MNRFLIFAYNQYYPKGGLGDFKGSFEEREEAFKAIEDFRDKDHREVLDTLTGINWYSHQRGPWEQKNPEQLPVNRTGLI